MGAASSPPIFEQEVHTFCVCRPRPLAGDTRRKAGGQADKGGGGGGAEQRGGTIENMAQRGGGVLRG